MTKVKQLTAWVDSRPGELGRIADALAKAKVNISAVTCWSAGGENPVHLVVSSPSRAKKVLLDLGVRLTEEEVLRIKVPDKLGALADLAVRLGAGNINIEYAYSTVPAEGSEAELVLSLSDMAGALKILHGKSDSSSK